MAARQVYLSELEAAQTADGGQLAAVDELELLEQDEAVAVSALGHPITTQVLLRKANGEELDLPHAPMVDVAAQKTIVSTPLTGRAGTVKELISLQDYRVTIRGFLIRPDKRYPLAETRELNAWFKHNEALEVVSEILNELGIYNLVVESLDLPDPEEWMNFQAYTLSCLSDEPLELELADQNLANVN